MWESIHIKFDTIGLGISKIVVGAGVGVKILAVREKHIAVPLWAQVSLTERVRNNKVHCILAVDRKIVESNL